jgi:hypothetical protein
MDQVLDVLDGVALAGAGWDRKKARREQGDRGNPSRTHRGPI